MSTNPKVDFFFNKPSHWQKEYQALREIILGCDLIEQLKWGQPCYTYNDANIVLIHGFKDYCALLFMKGTLLKDPKNILIQQTENVQSARQIRFTSLQEITKLKAAIRSYVYEAVKLEESGAKVEFRKTKEFPVPEEFKVKLDKNASLKKAFNALTPGRQRGYLLYFSSAKQVKTREQRIEKYKDHILNGKGLEDE
ncbi:MAG TPA: DUF1801 domain-containing protein [Cyclobacteriaceae bacterium]